MDDRPGEAEAAGEEPRAVASRRGWQIHGAALVGWVVFFFAVNWHVLTRPTPGFDGLGAVFMGFALSLHACVSTLVVALARRHRRSAAIVVHAAVLAAFVIGRCVELQDEARRAREQQAR
jgi:hypothetical protein